MSAARTPSWSAIDMLDAAELAEICDYVADRLFPAGDPPAPASSGRQLARFGASCEAPTILVEELERFSDLLVRLVPLRQTRGKIKPHRAARAWRKRWGWPRLLIGLAIDGWPADPDHAQALDHDCRRWALRPHPHPRGDRVRPPRPRRCPTTSKPCCAVCGLPHIRRAPPRTCWHCPGQRWEPAEVLPHPARRGARRARTLKLATRRAAAAFPTGKTFEVWDPALSSIAASHPDPRCAPSNGSPGGRIWWSAGRRAPAKTMFLEARRKPRWKPGAT